MEKINVAELLKDCPKGMELDCVIHDDITLFEVDDPKNALFPIKVLRPDGCEIHLTKCGQYADTDFSKCVIFPKGKTTWEGFQRPFKDGDIVVTETIHNFIFYSIYKGVENRGVLTYVDYTPDDNRLINVNHTLCYSCEIIEQRLATEEEKQKLFDAIKANGYKWNSETKTLKKLVEPKFKVGDRIKHKNGKDINGVEQGVILSITDDTYDVAVTNNMGIFVLIAEQDEWELVPNKFDISTLVPLESKVLVRNVGVWLPAFWGYYSKEYTYPFVVDGGNTFAQCIPYEGNEYLLGTTNDCDNFYKIW